MMHACIALGSSSKNRRLRDRFGAQMEALKDMIQVCKLVKRQMSEHIRFGAILVTLCVPPMYGGRYSISRR